MMKILVVDDDTMLLKQLKGYLVRRDFEVRTAQSAEAALKLIKDNDFDPGVVITDVRMGTMSGLDLVSHVHESDSEIFIIVMTGYGTIEIAVEAMRKGAFDFITKPFRTSVILEKLESIKAELELRRELQKAPSTEEAMPRLADAAGWLKERAGELPMLLISPRPKKHFQKEWGLEGFEHLWLTNESHDKALPPGHLYSLTSHIEAFTENHETGLVYLEGLGRLATLHQWGPIANLLGKLSTLVQEKGFHLCLGLAEEELDSTQRSRLQRQITDRLVHRSLALWAMPQGWPF